MLCKCDLNCQGHTRVKLNGTPTSQERENLVDPMRISLTLHVAKSLAINWIEREGKAKNGYYFGRCQNLESFGVNSTQFGFRPITDSLSPTPQPRPFIPTAWDQIDRMKGTSYFQSGGAVCVCWGGGIGRLLQQILQVINNIKFPFLITQVNFAKYISARDISKSRQVNQKYGITE